MAVTPLNAFSPTDYAALVAREFAQAWLIPTSNSPTTLVITALSLPAVVLLAAAVATTNATQATIGSKAIVVALNTGIVIGQLVVVAGVQPGTVVTSIASTTIGISKPTTAALATASTNFITPVTNATGIAVTGMNDKVLVIGSNTFLVYVAFDGEGAPSSIGGYPSFGASAILNVAAGV